MNRRINDNRTIVQYFNNSKGFNTPHIIKINNINVKVEVYSHNLEAKKTTKIEDEIKETINHFKESFGLERSDLEQILKIYIFDDKDDYTYLGGKQAFNFGLSGDEGGKCYYRGKPGVFAEMYVYQQGNVYNLQHELAHGLTYLATGGKALPTVLMEGIADYCEHLSDHKFNSQGFSIDTTQAKNLHLDAILKLKYASDDEQNSLIYKTGHALVMYLQEKNPHLLKDYMETLRAGDSGKSQNFLNEIIQNNDDFKSWLAIHNTEVAMKDINALQIEKGEFIGTKKEIVSGEIKDVSYYKADINKIDGGNVGSFSPVEHVSVYDYARAVNKATNDHLDISKEYHFLKIIEASNGQYQLTYCDKQGNEYKNSLEYKNQAFRVISNYEESLKESHEQELKKLDEGIRQKSSEILSKYSSQEISYQEMLEEYNLVNSSSRYEDSKSSMFDNIMHAWSAKIKAEKGIDVDKILDGLINIDSNVIENITLQNGKVFSLKALGHGNKGALSVYDGDRKIGELSSEAGFFKQVEGQTKETFLFEDILHGLNVQYEGGAYMAITKENEHYKASFIDGRKVESDEYFEESHLHENELLNPSMNHIKEENLDSLLLNNTKILNHKDSKFAQYSDEQKQNEIIVEKGKLLNDKGTDRADDDIYEAIVSQKGQSLYTFKNIGFYITEERHDIKGREASQLFIHDYGKDMRFELPSNITHLKLVQKNGENKLIPATKNGVECSNIPDEYKYIDPIFAHECEIRNYSHKHVNIGLINLDKYEPGTLFAIEYDPNDYNIQRNSRGEIIRLNDQTYFTKVKLSYNEEDIGMLSNNFHNFQDKIFFSADYNYSYSDFLASVSPQVEIKDMEDGSKRITFNQGSGDIGDTDKGYTDHQRIFIKETQPRQQVREEQSDENSSSATNSITNTVKETQSRQQVHDEQNDENSSSITNSITKTVNDAASKTAASSISGWWAYEQERQEVNDEGTRSSQIRGVKMQSDQPVVKTELNIKKEDTMTAIAIQQLFPNKESVKVNDNLTIEIKYGGMASYTPDYIKETVQKAYTAWCNNFYQQKSNHGSEAKLQLYVFKNYGDYKKYIEEVSGKNHNELGSGGTVRVHDVDGTIAKTFVIGDVGFICARSKYLMEKMNDGFLEYATGNINNVPDVLRTGMKLFMWSYDADQKKSGRDMHYVKEAYNKMKELGHDTPYKIASAAHDYRIADCLVTFLQEKHPSLIGELISKIRYNHINIKAELERSLNNSTIDREFKQWMDQASGNEIVAELVPDTDVMTFVEHKIKVNVKYDAEEVDDNKLASVKDTIKDAMEDFNLSFGINNSQTWHNIPNEINILVFNTSSDYRNYLTRLGIYDKSSTGITTQGRGSDVYVHFYLQNEFDQSCKVLKHELGHALTIINSYWGTGGVLPVAMHEGIANYTAGMENGKHVNDHGDIKALIAIKEKNLRPNEILSNNYHGEHYYSEAEQVIKFLEDKHSDVLDNLLNALSYHKAKRSDGHKLIEDFMQNLKDYDSEFKEWVEEQIRNQSHEQKVQDMTEQITSNSIYDQHAQSSDQRTQLDEQKDHKQIISNSIYDQHMHSDQPHEQKDQTNLKAESNSRISSDTKSLSNVPNGLEQEHPDREKREVKHQELVILKDTILKIEKNNDQDSQGKHKANVVIDYYDMKDLYEKAEESEKRPVLDFWNKLHVSGYKLGVLPEEKYYFMQDKFFIHDDQERKCIVLPEDKISIKVMKLGKDYNVVILNKKGDVINSISKVENLNYDLLSDSGSFSLETKNSIELADQHSEYDLYLINGLGGKMFDCTDNHNYNDYSLI